MAMATAKKSGKKIESKKTGKSSETAEAKASPAIEKNDNPKLVATKEQAGKRGRPSAKKEEEAEAKSSPEPTAKNQDKESSSKAPEQAQATTPQPEATTTVAPEQPKEESPLDKYMQGDTVVINSSNIADAVRILKDAGKIHTVSPSEIKTISTTPKPEPTAKAIKPTSLDFLTPNNTFNGTQEFKNEYGNLNSQLPQQPIQTGAINHAEELKKYAKSFYENLEHCFQFKMWGFVPVDEINRLISASNKKYSYKIVEIEQDMCYITIRHEKIEENTPQFKFQ